MAPLDHFLCPGARLSYGAGMSDELATLDATAQAELVRRGKLSPSALVDAAIARVEAVNPKLNAVIIPLFEKARAQAASPNLPRGPFRGVPFLLKDLLAYSADDPHHMGTRLLKRLGFVAPHDPNTAPPPRRPFAEEVGADPGRLRIGILVRLPGEIAPTHPDCRAAAESAARLLESLGHAVEPSHPGALDEVEVGRHFSMMYATHVARMVDVLGELTGASFGPDDLDPLNWALTELGRACTAQQYLATVDWLHGYTRRMAGWWASGFDLLLTPTLPQPPPPLGTFTPSREDPVAAGMRAAQFAGFTSPFNMTGQPAISLPLEWNDEGLPIGIQLAAAYGREDLLIRVAAQLEQARPWAERRPPIHA